MIHFQRNVLPVVLLSFVLLIPLQAQKPSGPIKPNLILITVDDLGWNDLGCYGADLHETPHIDAFAKTAVRFTDAYAAASICTPTRAALLTGKSPARLNMTIWREAAKNTLLDRMLIPPDVVGNLPLEEETIAEVLKHEGYLTAHLGKWHVGDGEHFPELQGFDLNVGATVWGCPPSFFFPYRGIIGGGSSRFVPGLEKDGEGRYSLDREGEYLTDRLTDEAIAMIRQFHKQPFFINLSYYTVHTPIEAKPELIRYYQEKVQPEMHHQNAAYAAMVQILDENVGRLLQTIDDLKLTNETVIIFTSDNGGFINEWDSQQVTSNAPLRSGKGALYEGGIRVPTMIRWPGKSVPGEFCSTPITTQDIFPTVLEMVGYPVPDTKRGLDGMSLIPFLENPGSEPFNRSLFWHYPHYYPTTTPVGAIRQGVWKLLHFFEDDRLELFNLEQDLEEQHNVASEHPNVVDHMVQELKAWQQEVDAPMPHRKE